MVNMLPAHALDTVTSRLLTQEQRSLILKRNSEDDSSSNRVQSDRSATEKPHPNSRDLWAISMILSYRDNIWTPVADYEDKEAMIKEFRRRYRFIKAKTKRFKLMRAYVGPEKTGSLEETLLPNGTTRELSAKEQRHVIQIHRAREDENSERSKAA